ncbi:hypothetical protein [Streptomyces sp. NBC_00151]|uniref:hypothetical protein n=1 Tax=Streptomyces sp. NBC_00151 TaxID=2975669 RepID=UPI002DD9D56F|nr:hypothetical protein [Streptomyces sp. NBC_00151]WRZ43454.1 hypothetical protein OG915_38655 [Streptomyces sp. NBC_00151]
MSGGIVLMSDRRVATIPLQDCREDLVDVRTNGLKVDDRLDSATILGVSADLYGRFVGTG